MDTYWPTPAMNFFVFVLYAVFPFNFGLFICDSFKRALVYGLTAGGWWAYCIRVDLAIRALEFLTMFKYIITGDGYMALPVKSDMNWLQFRDYIREQSYPRKKREMPCFKWGVIEFVNPQVMSVNDFSEHGCALI